MKSSNKGDDVESSVEGDVKDSVGGRLGDSVGGRGCDHGAVDSSGIDFGVGRGRGTAENGAEKSGGDTVDEGDEVCPGGGLDGAVGDELGNSVEEESAGGMVGNSVGGGEGGGAETGVGSSAAGDEGCAGDLVDGSCTGRSEDW